MKLLPSFLVPFVLAGGLAGSPCFAAVALVEEGMPTAEVILAADATPDEMSAANELVRFLEKSTGATLPIRREHNFVWEDRQPVVVVGLTPAPETIRARVRALSGDGYVVDVDGGIVHLVGKGRHGTSFAVYEFLERFAGVRWFWPGEVGEVVPPRRSLVVENTSIDREPAFLWRALGPGGSLWGPFDRWAKQRDLGISEEHQAEMALWEKRNRFGGELIYGGHAFGEILPPSIYGPTNPEYYALVNGERDWRNFNGKHRAQLCTSNPEVVRKVVEYCLLMFDRRPELDGVSISPNDGRGFCECEDCRALDVGGTQQDEADPEMGDAARTRIITDRMMTFGSQVAEAVSRTHPNKKILFYAYSQFHTPPERVRTHPNLIVQYTVNSAAFWNEEARATAFREFREWKRMAPTFGVYEYLTQTNFPDMPRLIPDLIRMELEELQRLGSRHYQSQAGNGFSTNGLNFYVLGRLLWDPSADVGQIQADYVNNAFGPAAPAMARYFDRFIASWRSQQKKPPRMNAASLSDYRDVLGMYPQDLIDGCRSDLEEAARLSSGDHRRRVEFVRDGFRYFTLTIGAAQATFPLLQAGWNPRNAEARPPGVDSRQVEQALDLWRKRDRYIEQHREDFVLSYMWVRSGDHTRSFNPLRALGEL